MILPPWAPCPLRVEFGNFGKDPLIKKPKPNEKVWGETILQGNSQCDKFTVL